MSKKSKPRGWREHLREDLKEKRFHLGKHLREQRLPQPQGVLGVGTKVSGVSESTGPTVEAQRLAELVFAALAEKARQAAEALIESGDSLREQGSLVTAQLEVAGKVLAEVPTRRMLFPDAHWGRVVESGEHLLSSMRRYARRQDVFRRCVDELVQFVKSGGVTSPSLPLGERLVTVPLDAVARFSTAHRYHASVMCVGSDLQQDAWTFVLGGWREKDPSTVPGCRP